jgi:DNA-binding XRE family transcriptional regulator
MKDRIQAFLQSENKSYAQFAEEIGVQPSGISHILSGRNNPSLDFVIIMLHGYPLPPMNGFCLARAHVQAVSQPTLFEMSHLKTWMSGQVLLKLRKKTAIRVLIQACMKAVGKRQGSFMKEQENPVRGPGSSLE